MTQPNVIVFDSADVSNIPMRDENNTFTGTNKFGSDTNYLQISNAGDLSLVGTAKYERHVQIDATASGNPASQATAITIGTAVGFQFSSALDKYAGCQWEIPDDLDGTDCYIEIDWLPDSGAMSGTDAIRWTVVVTAFEIIYQSKGFPTSN